MRRNGLFWGVILLVLGSLFLLNNLGILRFNVWGAIGPVFLILFGIWIVYGATRGRQTVEVETTSVSLDGARNVALTLHHGAGRLIVKADPTAIGTISGTFGGGLAVAKTIAGDDAKVELHSRVGSQSFWSFPWSFNGRNGLDWDVALSRDCTYALRLETGADDATVDLRDLKVTDLHLSTGASSMAVTLPEAAGYTRVKLEAGAASVTIKVPGGVAAQIRSQSGVSSINIDETRFPKTSGVYRSPDYDTAVNKVDIDIQMGAGSVRVN